MFWSREKHRRFSLPPRYGLLFAWVLAVLGVFAAMRFTALPLVR